MKAEKLLATVRQAQSPESVWQPLAGPQTAAYESDADELFYGGAAGGGKTDLLLGLAGRRHWRSIIFRRVFPSLRGVVERSREVFNPGGDSHSKNSYNESLHMWRLSSGRIVEFGAIQHEKDKENYRGRPHDLYGWDEVTEFTESQFRFVNTWNRTTRKGQRCRVVATGNPPTAADGEWVIRYWSPWLDGQHSNPAQPGELRWFARVDDEDKELEGGEPFEYKGETIVPRSRTFIPARLSDNPILAATGYGAVLQGLPEPLRSQLLYGDFAVGVGDDPWQAIPTAWVLAAQARWRERVKPKTPLTCIGVDVARGGKDKTIFAPRYDNYFDSLHKYAGAQTDDGPKVVALLIPLMEGGAIANIDVIGVGSSVYDFARAMKINAYAVNVANASDARDKTNKYGFVNLRAEYLWKLREALDPQSGQDIALPDDREVLADLCAARYSVQANGIKVESKDDIKKRLGRSPDCGDAVILAHADARGRIRSKQVVSW